MVRTPRKWKLKPEWIICGNDCGSISSRLLEEPCVTTQRTAVEQIIQTTLFKVFPVFVWKGFPFSPLFLNNSESRVNVAYPEQSHSTITHKIDSTVKQNFKIGAAIEARSRLMLCTWKKMYSSYLFGQSDSVVANTVSLGASILTYKTSHSFGSFDSWTSALPFLSIGLILPFGGFSLFALHNNCHLKVFSSFVCFADGRYSLSIAESVVFNLQNELLEYSVVII